ncbi:MAG TPA: choice-of-anchor tandem repeat GloVer-containing protein [Verrucomicrobiae bacterium]|jgi:uncharacterized repeat protein (TIGR03803 family)
MKRHFAVAVAILAGMFAGHVAAQTSGAQIYSNIHSFSGPDGAQPYAALIATNNTLFSTTKFGGSTGNGTVFTVNTDGTGFGVIHNFVYSDGGDIEGDLVLSGNTLYGAAYQGGAGIAQGALYSLQTDGSGFADTYNFLGTPDGDDPKAGLIFDGNSLYGTTASATVDGNDGSVFSVSTNGENFTTLHKFTGDDGSEPTCDLVLVGGVLYGTTYSGGVSNLGVIFSVQTNGENFTVLHTFSPADGTHPAAGLTALGGTLFGTASQGGDYGVGSIFAINTTGGNFRVLYSFVYTPAKGNTDGNTPLASLYLSHKILYGTTSAGGVYGQGSVFSIDYTGNGYTQIYSFGANADDGLEPASPVVAIGNFLYGTTTVGGAGQNGAVYAIQIRGVALTQEPNGETNAQAGTDVFFGTGAVSLTAPATPIQYQWRLNGVNIPGATNEFLEFDNVQPTNGGSVTMIASDGVDATASAAVGFSVEVPTVVVSNNSFANRFDLGSTASGVVTGSNKGATKQTGEPNILAGNPGGKSIWFRWLPKLSGTATFTTRGSDFDTMLGIYTGSNVTALTRVPSGIDDDDYGGYLTSLVSFNCTGGTEYDIAVDGYWGASGNVVLSWSTARPAEPQPTILQAPPKQTVVSNGAAVTFVCITTNGEPTWYFNGQPTGVSGPNFVINSVSAKNVGTYVAEVTAGGATVFTEPAHLQISVLEDGTTDPDSAGWGKFLDSANAPYSNPGLDSIRKLGNGGDTRGYSVAQTFSTVGATTEPGEPTIAGQIGGSPVWYTWVTPTNGALLINTSGSSFNTLLGVFIGSGGSFETLTNVGQGYTTNRSLYGQPQVYISDEPKGQTNFIVVDGYNGTSGTVHLNINLGTGVVINTPPQDQFVAFGSNATFTVGATGSTPLYYYWQFNGTNIAGATTSSLTITNAQSAVTGLYNVIVSNGVSVNAASANLAFGTAPAITAQPESQTVALEGTANLNVTATGEPPPHYQWFFNDHEIGGDGSVITIPGFDDSNAGVYYVVVSNSIGVTTSSNAQVVLNTLKLGSPSINAGNFQTGLTGAAGGTYILQTSVNLLNWTPLSTNYTSNGFLQLTVSNVSKVGYRFYRGVTN